MKICDLTCLYHRHGGGIKTYIDNKRLIYQKRQISHLLIAPNVLAPKKITKIKKGSLAAYFVPCRRVFFAKTPYYTFSNFAIIVEIIKKETPDIIEVGDKIITFLFKKQIKRLSKIVKTKIFVFSHERADNFSRIVLGDRFLHQLWAKFFISRFIKAGEVVICNSNFTAEEVLKYLPKEKVKVLTLGIDVADFSKEKYYDEKLCQYLRGGNKKVVLIHVGRLDKDKKIGLLVQIAKRLDCQKYRLVVVGSGGYENDLKNISAVKLVGHLPHEKVKKYLAASQIGILVNDVEPYGLVGLEMMAMGLPILGPNKGGLTSFLKKDFAWLLPYEATAYLTALAEWEKLSDEAKQKMSQRAQKEAERYSLDRMVDRLLEIYRGG